MYRYYSSHLRNTRDTFWCTHIGNLHPNLVKQSVRKAALTHEIETKDCSYCPACQTASLWQMGSLAGQRVVSISRVRAAVLVQI